MAETLVDPVVSNKVLDCEDFKLKENVDDSRVVDNSSGMLPLFLFYKSINIFYKYNVI